ncbi:ParB/RepB/Spo0J family partition protein [Piscirickettsia litoralis]|uniref:ParB-like N-terminal domain-containing protein n=1 Tax=Piscirickettsia litoralis TaxID=1891921 RepID=A0ABX3A4Z8_9GAMM|nr:ParB/RepB/Spo0J family partition protein [Piscirickettsia litoralis]ODN41189.1 hypothetical protein BGC07_17400 [Piscirickettsia litoralis]
MASRAIQIRRKPKQKKLVKDIDDFVESHNGLKSELWADVEDCFLSPLKTDRKNISPEYIAGLAEDLKKRQINAVVAREYEGKYEVIAGECRYRAAKSINIKLLVRVVDWSDEEAIATIISENEKREDLCDYEKALFYLDCKGSLSIRAFAEKHNLDRNYVNRLFKLEKIPSSVESVFPMVDMSASQFEEIASRIKENSYYEDVFVALAPLLSQIETPITWKAFLAKVDRKVNPPERQPKKKIERYVFKAKDKEIGNIKPTETGYSVTIKKKMNQKNTRRFSKSLRDCLKSFLNGS